MAKKGPNIQPSSKNCVTTKAPIITLHAFARNESLVYMLLSWIATFGQFAQLEAHTLIDIGPPLRGGCFVYCSRMKAKQSIEKS